MKFDILANTKKSILIKVFVVVAILIIMMAILTLVVSIDERRFPDWLVDIIQKPLLLIDKYGNLVIFILPGIVLALIAFIPSIRRLAYKNSKARKRIILSVGILTLFMMFVFVALLEAYIVYLVATVYCGQTDENLCNSLTEIERETYQTNQSIIIQEFWLRAIIPSPLRWSCYTNELEICSLVDSALKHPSVASLTTWRNYLYRIILSLPSALIGASLAWWFTRQKKKVAFQEE